MDLLLLYWVTLISDFKLIVEVMGYTPSTCCFGMSCVYSATCQTCKYYKFWRPYFVLYHQQISLGMEWFLRGCLQTSVVLSLISESESVKKPRQFRYLAFICLCDNDYEMSLHESTAWNWQTSSKSYAQEQILHKTP